MPKSGKYFYEEVSLEDENGNTSDACIILGYDRVDDDLILSIPDMLGGIEVYAVDHDFWNTIPDIQMLVVPRTVRDLCYYEDTLDEIHQPSRTHLCFLEKIIVEEGNPVFHSLEGILYLNGTEQYNSNSSLYMYPPAKKDKQLFVPSGCTRIDDFSFCSAIHLTELIAPEVEYIGKGAFCGCVELRSVNCCSASQIGPRIFDGCSNVLKLTIGKEDVLVPEIFKGIRCTPKLELEGDSLKKYCKVGAFVIHVERYKIEAVYYRRLSKSEEVYVPAIVYLFNKSIFAAAQGVKTVIYNPGTVCEGEDIPGVSFVCRYYPTKVRTLRNNDYILCLPFKDTDLLDTGNAKAFRGIGYRNCRSISNLIIGRNLQSDQIPGLLSSVRIKRITGLEYHGLEIIGEALFDRQHRFICVLAGSKQKTVICKEFSKDITGIFPNVTTLVIDSCSFHKSICELDRFPNLEWLFIRTFHEIKINIPVSEKYRTVIFRAYLNKGFIGDNVRYISTSEDEYSVHVGSKEESGTLICLHKNDENGSEKTRLMNTDKLLPDNLKKNIIFVQCLRNYYKVPVDIHNSDKKKLEDVAPEKIGSQASGGIKSSDRKTTNRRVFVPLRHIIKVTQKFRCIREGHTLEDVTIKVRMLAGSSLSVIDLPAGYCRECGSYYVYSSVFDELIGSRMRPGVEILQNRFKMPDGRFYGSIYETTGTLQSESLLKRCGYTVGITAGLSDRSRITLLRQIIDMELMTKQEVMSYLNYFISFNGRKLGNEIAKMQWERDLMEISRS